MKHVLVTSYVNPDLDGVASAIAYAELLRSTGADAVAGIIGRAHDEATFMLTRCGAPSPMTIANADGFDEVVLVDVSDLNDLEGTVASESVVEIIDHRLVHDLNAFPNATIQIEAVGAAATLIAEKYMKQSVALSKESAALLYGGILSNTLNFKGSMTTNRDRNMAAWLNGIAQLPEDFWRELFMAKSDMTGDKLVRRIEDDVAWFAFGGTRVGIAEIELIGARKVLEERGGEIAEILGRMKKDFRLDIVYLNATELDDVATYIVAADDETRHLLAHVFSVSFVGTMAKLPQPMMRKQMTPMLKNALE